MKIIEFHQRITKIIEFVEFQARTKKIFKILALLLRIMTITENIEIPCENWKNIKIREFH